MSPITNTLIFGKVFHFVETCKSTNSLLKEMIANSKPLEGIVVYTDNQTEGRGQFGNIWQSEASKNLAFSTVLYPKPLPVSKQFYISKVVSIACVQALNSMTNLDFEIKWPNDIYCQGKKIGGILIENQLSNTQIIHSVVGVGINLNQEEFSNLPNASSLYLLVRYFFNKKKVLETILTEMDALYLQLLQGKYADIDILYHKHLMAYQKEFSFIENGIKKTAFLNSVNELGQLLILESQKERAINFKEIEWEV